jgi:hypothetical protein
LLRAASLVFALTGATALDTGSPAGVPSAGEWVVERAETRGAVEAGRAVKVGNPHGNVVVRGGDEGEIMVLSLAQRQRTDPRHAEVAIRPGVEEVTVEASWAQAAPAAEGGEAERHRIDLTVLVPPGSAVSIETIDGDVEAKGLRAPLRVETVRGDVRAVVTGEVVAVSEHGALLVHFLSTGWQRGSRLTTTTGAITAELPAGGEATVTFHTAGSITTDYSVEIERDERSSRKTGSAVIGGGGKLLEIESDRGPITLMASLVPDVTSHRTGSAEVPR